MSDLILPVWRETDERKLLKLSRVLTGFWGLAQMGVALVLSLVFLDPKDQAIRMVLDVASLSAGILLGLFLAALAFGRVSQTAGLIGLIGGGAIVIWVKLSTPIAFTWFALIGSSSVFTLIALARLVFRPAPQLPSPEPNTPSSL